MSQENNKIQIDRWLKGIGNLARRKVWFIVFSLDLEWQLRDNNYFNVPLHKLLSNPLVNKEDLAAILTGLHNKEVLVVIRYVGELEESNDPDAPEGSNFTTIEFNPSILDYPDMKIRIVRENFNYLKGELKKLAKQNLNQSQTQSHVGKIEWRNDFKLDVDSFVFGNYGKISFKSKDRKNLFQQLFNAKGAWVTVQKLTGSKDANYVRATIKQIEDQMQVNLKKHLKIPSTQDDELEPRPLQGAYRLRFTESK